MAAMLVLLIAGSYKVQKWGDFWWHDIHTKFHEDPSVGCNKRHHDVFQGRTARKLAYKFVFKTFKNIFTGQPRVVGLCSEANMAPHLKIIVIFGTNIRYISFLHFYFLSFQDPPQAPMLLSINFSFRRNVFQFSF
jgi:hypothetical protein